MILADTPVWVDHFRSGDETLQAQLLAGNIAVNEFAIADLALGKLSKRVETLAFLKYLPAAPVAGPKKSA